MFEHKTYVVAKNAFFKNFKSAAYLSTIFAPIIILMIALLVGYFVGATKGDDKPTIAVYETQPTYIRAFKDSKIAQVKMADSKSSAEKMLKDKKVDGILQVSDDLKVVNFEESSGTKSSLEPEQLQQVFAPTRMGMLANQYNLSPQILQDLNTPVTVNKDILSTESSKKSDTTKVFIAQMVSNVLMYIIFIFAMIYAQIMGNEIGIDKGTKTLQGILAIVSKKNYFFGKLFAVIGLFISSLVIYAIIVGIVLIGVQFTQFKDMVNNFNLFEYVTPTFVIYTALLNIIAFLVILVLSAMFSTFVSRPEDAAKAASPLVFMLMVPYIISVSIQSIPNSMLAKVTSYLPMFSQQVMPMRLTKQVVGDSSALIAVGIQLAGFIALFYLGYKMYDKYALEYSDESPTKAFFAAFKKNR